MLLFVKEILFTVKYVSVSHYNLKGGRESTKNIKNEEKQHIFKYKSIIHINDKWIVKIVAVIS